MMTKTTAAETAAAEAHYAGILHRNSMDLVAQGPWILESTRCLPGGTPVRVGQTTEGLDVWTTHGGTCACCHQSITNIAYYRHANDRSQRMTLGLDCAKTLERNSENAQSVRKIESAEKAHQRKLSDARKARKADANRVAYQAELDRCEALAAASEGFVHGFADSVADQIRRGKAPSAKQLALLAKLESEVAA